MVIWSSEGRPQFAALHVAADAVDFVEARIAFNLASGGDGRVEITLANRRKIALGIAADPMAVARLVQVLDRARSRFRLGRCSGSRAG